MAVLWQQRWVLVGDSIQAWVLDDYSTNPPKPGNLTATRIASAYQAATMQNLSCPGATLSGVQGLGKHSDDVKRATGFFGINGFMCTLGTNDLVNADITQEQFFLDYLQYVTEIREFTTAPIVLVSPINRFDGVTPPGGKTLAGFAAAVQQVVSSLPGRQVYFIDGRNAPLNASHFGDGLHLNNAGHVVFGDWLYSQVHALGLW